MITAAAALRDAIPEVSDLGVRHYGLCYVRLEALREAAERRIRVAEAAIA